MYDLIKELHVNVDSTAEDMINSGWQEISELKPGAVLCWENKIKKSGQPHKHIGFYIDDSTAISNDSDDKLVPHVHSIDYGGSRKIEKILWHPRLAN